MNTLPLSRRQMLAGLAATALPALPVAAADNGALLTRPIPRSGEPLPVIGIGTSVVFDFQDDPAKYAERRQVLQELAAGGGKLIDTAPAYGNAEPRVGDLVADLGIRDKLFLATKVSAQAPRDEKETSLAGSLQRLKTKQIDLMQAWNVSDPNLELAQLRDWKAQGKCRYWGITSSFDSAYPALEQVIKREKPEFFQINYSLGHRDAEERLLPAAQDVGAAVLTNLPFGRNSMFAKVRGKPLPDWAAEIDAKSWAQVFLKFLLSHPAVTAVIPGTDKPEYMLDNLAAGRGRLPDAALRKRMIEFWSTL
ncbi:MAG: aldo/keto reductase [Burkholderiaceae bacterium]|jgi:aryl-alcohol dehydrogenase-like predicted oxidoreductase|nr:aldo/keto reductase [Burkholderiaceae bacterium]